MIEIRFSEIEFFVALVLLAAAGIQLFFYWFFFIRVRIAKIKQSTEIPLQPVSVIICAKNEEYNLRKFLPMVLDQTYPKFEVIVVNDCSIDETETYVTQLQKKYSHLKYTFIKDDPKFKHNKKLAVTLGIKAASYDYFFFIDADCYPQSSMWLATMFQKFQNNKQIILGYGGYEQTDGFLDKLVRYDTFDVAVHYLSFAHAGLPYMGVGRNMAYTRSAYEQSSKFTKHYHIQSGDDDLFVREVGTSKNTAIELCPDAFTRSEQVETFKQWCSQKRRHISTSYKYKFIHKLLLTLEPLSRYVFYSFMLLYAFLWLGFNTIALWQFIVAGVFLRFVSMLIVNYLNMKRLEEKKILLYSPIFDVVIPFLIGLFFIQNKLNNRRRRWR